MPLASEDFPAPRRMARLAAGCMLLLWAGQAAAQAAADTAACSVLWQVTAQPGRAADAPPGDRKSVV